MNFSEVQSKVRTFYERFPYPHYPLLAKPRWQEGYLASSLFARAMFLGLPPTQNTKVLCLGSGEILPYVLRKWEHSSSQITCVDSSKRSLTRARVRMASRFLGSGMIWEHTDIESFLERTSTNDFQHIDAYGVLHHLSDPQTTLQQMERTLKADGTVRLMVYNKKARTWIWEINRFFHTMKLNPHVESDLSAAKNFLTQVSILSPAIADNLKSMGQSTLKSNTRFVDTFMHPHELRVSIARWYEMIENTGFKIVGLFDRYAELDDLENPLWNPPTVEQLQERADDFRFENNLEIFLVKSTQKSNEKKPKILNRNFSLLSPPKNCFSYRETNKLSTAQRNQIWQNFLKGLNGQKQPEPSKSLPQDALGRLARCGMILPHGLDASLLRRLNQPLNAQMEAPHKVGASGHQDLNPIFLKVEQICRFKALSSSHAVLAKKRLLRLLFDN